MSKALVMTESGDWYLVDWEHRHNFWEDELEEREINYAAEYIGNPSNLKIVEYER